MKKILPRLAGLRDAPEAPAPTDMVALLDRLDWVRGIGVARERTTRVHPARLVRLVEEGGIMTAQHLANVEPCAGPPCWWQGWPTSKCG